MSKPENSCPARSKRCSTPSECNKRKLWRYLSVAPIDNVVEGVAETVEVPNELTIFVKNYCYWLDLGVPVWITKVLARENIATVSQLREIGEAEFLRIPNLGRVAYRTIGNFIGWRAS